MPKFDSVFGYNSNWTFHPLRRLVKGNSQAEPKDEPDSGYSEQDKSSSDSGEASESGIKRIGKKKSFKCPTEPFLDTLKILEEMLIG